MLYAGFASVEITPPFGTDMPGDFIPHTANGTYGGLFANAAAFTVDETSLLLVSMDILDTSVAYADRLRARISEATGLPRDSILVAATHTHTGGALDYPIWLCPLNAEVAAATFDRTLEAAVAAWANRAPARLGTAHTTEPRYNFVRDFLMTDGTIKMNPGHANADKIVRIMDEADHDLDVMRVDRPDGSPAAFLVNYALHPDCHHRDKFNFSADFPGYMRRALQAYYGDDVTVLFFNGCCGDVNCIDFLNNTTAAWYGEGKNAPETIGQALAADIIGLEEALTADETAPRIAAITGETAGPRRRRSAADEAWARAVARDCLYGVKRSTMDRAFAADYLDDDNDPDTLTIEVHAIRLGDWAIIGLPGEIYTDIGRRIKAGSPFARTVIFEMANGTRGYIPTREIVEADLAGVGPYEAKVAHYNSQCDPGTADRLVAQALALLETLKGREAE